MSSLSEPGSCGKVSRLRTNLALDSVAASESNNRPELGLGSATQASLRGPLALETQGQNPRTGLRSQRWLVSFAQFSITRGFCMWPCQMQSKVSVGQG